MRSTNLVRTLGIAKKTRVMNQGEFEEFAGDKDVWLFEYHFGVDHQTQPLQLRKGHPPKGWDDWPSTLCVVPVGNDPHDYEKRKNGWRVTVQNRRSGYYPRTITVTSVFYITPYNKGREVKSK